MNSPIQLCNPAPSMTSRRRAAISVSLLLAALLNAGAIGMASQRAHPAVPTSQGAARATLVLLPPAPAQPVATEPVRLVTAPQPVQHNRPAVPDQAPQDKPPATPSPITSTALNAPPADETLAQPVRFYTFQEVDQAAEPDADWPIDIDTLDAIGIGRLVFELMVDDRGSVIACAVLDPSGLPEAARLELEQRLAATPLRPALRGGRLVASQRRIELLVEPNT